MADGILHFDWAVVTRNRPLTFALAFGLAIVSGLALTFNAKSESNSLDVFFKPDSEMYRAFTLVDDELGGSGVVSMIFASDMQDYYRQIDPFNEVRALETQLASLAQVNTVDSYTKPVGQIHRALVNDGTQYPQTDEQLAQEILFSEWSRSAESRDVLADTVNFGFDAKHVRAHTPNLSSTKLEALVREIDGQRRALNPQALPEVIYSGHSVFFGQLSGYILETQLVTIILTFCFIFVILMLEFDFRLAMAGMLACSLPILITMGSIAALGLPFDFETVIIASVTMGLSIDDTIHILHRYRFHLVDEHLSQYQSLRQALFIPGRPIVQSTFLFCFGAGVFLISDLVMLQRFAIFTMLGLVLALLGAVLLLPSLLSVPFFTKTAQAPPRPPNNKYVISGRMGQGRLAKLMGARLDCLANREIQAMQELMHFINGEMSKGAAMTQPRFGDVFNPCTGAVQARVRLGEAEDVAAGVAAARAAQPGWAATNPQRRARVMFKFKELLEANMDELAALLSSEHGKVIADAKGDIQRGLEVIEFACGIPHLLKGELTDGAGPDIDISAMRQPLGVVAGITPFNFPAMIPMWMFGVAIACGNTFILKPRKKTRLCLATGRIDDGGRSAEGVLNVVQGDKIVVDAILDHEDIKAVSFVGSSDIAHYVYMRGTANGKRVQAWAARKITGYHARCRYGAGDCRFCRCRLWLGR